MSFQTAEIDSRRYFAEAPRDASPFGLNEIGTIRIFERDAEVFPEGQVADHWYRVISGTVRLCKLFADGRRQIAEFYFDGDCFGLEMQPERLFAAEAIGRVVTMRYPHRATEQLLSQTPQLAHSMRGAVVHDLAIAQMRMLLLGRMTAAERVATFLLKMFDRSGTGSVIDLPMSRSDIADYLGLTIETVCRVITSFRRAGIISTPKAYRIELCNRSAMQLVLRDLRR